MQLLREWLLRFGGFTREWTVWFLTKFLSESRFRLKVIGAFVLVFIGYALISPPAGFPRNVLVSIPPGTTLEETAELLHEQDVIRSEFLFGALVILLEGDAGVVAGEYSFHRPASVVTVARVITSGNYGLELIKVTIPEGVSVREIPKYFDERFARFNELEFIQNAESLEGYLFPDTYYVRENITTDEVITLLQETFADKVKPYLAEVEVSGRSLSDIVTMASLLEEEARTAETRRIIAGILWKRLEHGMALQVDAVFPYLIGKNTYQLTREDLDYDSPYNTYRYPGLPPGPITNPGLAAIEAALRPQESPYWYYLSDSAGAMHYAKNFEEHKQNKVLYLN